jgi:hypothetical protein
LGIEVGVAGRGEMLEQVGDLWGYHKQGNWVCVTTNGCTTAARGYLVMGAGCAAQAATSYPKLPRILGSLVTTKGNHVYAIDEYRLFSFPTKEHWKDDSDLLLIERSAQELMAVMDEQDKRAAELGTDPNFGLDTKVYLPRPGCGLGNLNWEHVRIPLHDILDDRVVAVTHG